MAEIWMRTDYQHEGVHALEMVVEQLKEVLEDPYRWKWVVVATHNALHAFMVADVSGSDLLGAMTEKYAKHWREQYEKGEHPKKPERLADFPELFERTQIQTQRFVDARNLDPTESQEDSVGRLNWWRGEFVHYKPKSLSIEVSGFPEIVRDCLDVARFLAFESMYVFRVQDEWSERTERALGEANALLDVIKASYSTA
ncbi:MAG: hypothetical protein GEU71_04605 [Actinobacteria bacterium]|nr:hypothetical protein [Actinomycetota bacterium]